MFSDVRMLHNSHKSTCSSRAVCSREASLRRGGATRQRQLCVSNLHKALRQVRDIELRTRSAEAGGTQQLHGGCAALTQTVSTTQPVASDNLHCMQQSTGRLTAPEDVVYECLTLLRRPDLERYGT